MAEVYLAMETGLPGFRRRAVLKRILPQFAKDRDFVQMFLTEARIAGQLTHPNIAQVYEVGEAEGSFFIAMEYVDGPDLRALWRLARDQGRLMPHYLAAKIVSFACEGLGYAHAATDPESGERLNVIHRDVSPDNIILTTTGAVKVVDFGIAKAVGQVHQTAVGLLKGKLPYMAPEQMLQKAIDHRADIYSLGIVLYQLLAGARPYDGLSEVDLIRSVSHGEPGAPLEQRRPDVPADLAAIVSRAMAHDLSRRYPDCESFQADLERFIHGSPEPVGTPQIARLIQELAGQHQGRPSGPKATPVSGPRTPAAPRPLDATRAAPVTEPKSPRPETTVLLAKTIDITVPDRPAARPEEATAQAQHSHVPPLRRRRVAIVLAAVVLFILAGGTVAGALLALPLAPAPPPTAPHSSTPEALPATPSVLPTAEPTPLPVEAAPSPTKALPGMLVVDVLPYASVYIDGTLRQEVQGTASFKLAPGAHRVRLEHAKGAKSVRITVVSGKEVRITERF